MKQPDPHQPKMQLDRIMFFSDAVFAIAITLLIIEVKVPELSEIQSTDANLANQLVEMIGKFVGVLVSFLIIGRYWLFHHRLFGYVKTYNSKLMWANLIFLFSIVLMPFSTAIYSEYFLFTMKIPVIVYTINICFTALMNIRLINIVTSKREPLAPELNDRKMIRFFRMRSMVAPAMFILTSIISLLGFNSAYFVPVFFPFFSTLVNRPFRKSNPEYFKV